MVDFDFQVLRNQVVAILQNLYIWFLRAVLRLPPPPFLPKQFEHVLDAAGKVVTDANHCVCVEIGRPGGVDVLQARADCWATCGYDIMKEFDGCQRIQAPLASTPSGLVVVRNHAFSVNYADVCIRWGLYESALRYVGWPIIPGFDVAGVVEVTAGDGKSCFKKGDRVFGCSMFGGYSSRVATSERMLMRIPDNMDFEVAASLPAVAGTALHAVCLAGLWPAEPMGNSKVALVHSAAGGVGAMLCQILRLRGLRVVGIVGSASKVASCGADIVVDKSCEDWFAVAKRHSPEGYCAVFDANGVASLSSSYKLLSRNGRLVVYGFHSNLPKCDGGLGMLSPWTWLLMGLDILRMPRFDAMALTLDSKAVLGFNLSFFAEEHELVAKYLGQISQWVTEGKLTAPAIRGFSLTETREAHAALQSGRTVGKMVVTL